MRKLRNIGYVRFGSKIWQGFAGGITSLTPPLSLSPLWISWARNEGAREEAQLLYFGGKPAAAPAGRAGCLSPLHRAAGSRQGPPRKKNLYLFICRSLPPLYRAVGV